MLYIHEYIYILITCIWHKHFLHIFMRIKCKWTIALLLNLFLLKVLKLPTTSPSDVLRLGLGHSKLLVWGQFFGEYVYIRSLGNWHSQWRGFMLNRNNCIFKWFIVSFAGSLPYTLFWWENLVIHQLLSRDGFQPIKEPCAETRRGASPLGIPRLWFFTFEPQTTWMLNVTLGQAIFVITVSFVYKVYIKYMYIYIYILWLYIYRFYSLLIPLFT